MKGKKMTGIQAEQLSSAGLAKLRTIQAERAEAATIAASVPLGVAQQVMWYFGDQIFGVDGGLFVSRLLATMSSADPGNFQKLAGNFPEYAVAFSMGKMIGGVEALRDRVKADRS